MTEAQKQTRICELIMAADHYSQTGTVKERLLPCFDQHGKWIGTIADLPDLIVSTKLTKTVIPKEQIIQTNPLGEVVLLGSYVITSGKSHVVPYDHVRGDVLARRYKAVEAPNLKSVGGSVIAMMARTVKTPKLKSVWNHLFVNCAVVFESPELLTVGGCLITHSAEKFYKKGLMVEERWLVHPDAYRLWREREARALLRRCAGPWIEI